MGWKVGQVAQVMTRLNNFSGPGFSLQMDGRSPTVTFVFHDEAAAARAHKALEAIVDEAAAIIPGTGTV